MTPKIRKIAALILTIIGAVLAFSLLVASYDIKPEETGFDLHELLLTVLSVAFLLNFFRWFYQSLIKDNNIDDKIIIRRNEDGSILKEDWELIMRSFHILDDAFWDDPNAPFTEDNIEYNPSPTPRSQDQIDGALKVINTYFEYKS